VSVRVLQINRTGGEKMTKKRGGLLGGRKSQKKGGEREENDDLESFKKRVFFKPTLRHTYVRRERQGEKSAQ